MHSGARKASSSAKIARKIGTAGAIVALAAIVASAGCNDDEAQRAFRQAASSQLKTGLTSVVDGIVSGAFAVFDLGASDSSSGSTATGS
ncbi:MAG: hypothetical protein U1D55_15255 [Phycisphaerae bacterium]